MSLIDSDALFDAPTKPGPANGAVTGSQSIVGTKPTAPATTGPRSVRERFDAATKRGYVFDVSGSMGEVMPSAETIDSFDWDRKDWHGKSENYLGKVRERIAEAKVAVAKASANGLSIVDAVDPLSYALAQTGPELMTDDGALKFFIVERIMYHDLGIPAKQGVKQTKRIDLVATAARSIIAGHYDRYPEADVFGIRFQYDPVLFGGSFVEVDGKQTPNPDYDPDDPFCEEPEFIVEKIRKPTSGQNLRKLAKDEMLLEIDGLPATVGGGTNIAKAVNFAVDCFRLSPSPLQLHHMILITDAEDGSGYELWENREALKKHNIVLDFIHIARPFDQYAGTYDSNADYLRKLCAFTGGEYTRVVSAKDFMEKFIAADSRKLLPAPAQQIEAGK